MNKREELEAILEQLHEWCLKYDEDYAVAAITNNSGLANIDTERPDYVEMNIYRDYSKKPDSENVDENNVKARTEGNVSIEEKPI